MSTRKRSAAWGFSGTFIIRAHAAVLVREVYGKSKKSDAQTEYFVLVRAFLRQINLTAVGVNPIFMMATANQVMFVDRSDFPELLRTLVDYPISFSDVGEFISTLKTNIHKSHFSSH